MMRNCEGTKGLRDEGTKGLRDEGTKGRRDEGTKEMLSRQTALQIFEGLSGQ
jgi:hypothetical protein